MRANIAKAERRAAVYDRIATITVWSLAVLGLGILFFIIATIFWRGLGTALNPSFFMGKPQAMKEGGGIGPMIVSSFYLAFLTIIIVVPVGAGAAIYMSEFAKEGWITRAVRFGADTLSTVPSVIFGIFGLVLFVIYFGLGYSLLAGALTLTLLNIPTVMRTTEEAIKAVPVSYREASMGLGATRWQTIKKVVLPSAMPGITTGTVLTIGRIIGESAAIIFTVGIFIRKIPVSPLQPAAPMAANIWHTYTEGALVSDWMRVANGEAAFLLLVVLLLNLLARVVARLYQKRLGMVK
ncbi:MAG: phosphate ABC transporter permease PstA [Actinobacteria bacterium]|nr:phosphate ABC transporter permease PstA [Actinomycetota bacterium]